jgi:hypothetical protein
MRKLTLLLFVLGNLILIGGNAFSAKTTKSTNSVKQQDSKLSSSSAIWVDSPVESEDYTDTTSPTSEKIQQEENNKPFLIPIALTVSLTIVVAIMIWSIFNVNGKKKPALQNNNLVRSEESSLRLVDSLDLDGNKTIYLITFLTRQYLVASSLTSVNLIAEILEPTKTISKSKAFADKVQSSLDFLTVQDESSEEEEAITKETIENGLSRLIRGSEKQQDSKVKQVRYDEKVKQESMRDDNIKITRHQNIETNLSNDEEINTKAQLEKIIQDDFSLESTREAPPKLLNNDITNIVENTNNQITNNEEYVNELPTQNEIPTLNTRSILSQNSRLKTTGNSTLLAQDATKSSVRKPAWLQAKEDIQRKADELQNSVREEIKQLDTSTESSFKFQSTLSNRSKLNSGIATVNKLEPISERIASKISAMEQDIQREVVTQTQSKLSENTPKLTSNVPKTTVSRKISIVE